MKALDIIENFVKKPIVKYGLTALFSLGILTTNAQNHYKSKSNNIYISLGTKIWLDSEIEDSYKLTPILKVQYERKLSEYLSLEGSIGYISKIKSDRLKMDEIKELDHNEIKLIQGNLGIKKYLNKNQKLVSYAKWGVGKMKGYRDTAQRDPQAISRTINWSGIEVDSWGPYFGGGFELNKGPLQINLEVTLHKIKAKEMDNVEISAGLNFKF